jgi:hypothetical protein
MEAASVIALVLVGVLTAGVMRLGGLALFLPIETQHAKEPFVLSGPVTLVNFHQQILVIYNRRKYVDQ